MLRINEAIARAKDNGRNITKKELAGLLWPDREESTQVVNMNNICNGRKKGVNPDHVIILCDALDCDPNYLFAYEKKGDSNE